MHIVYYIDVITHTSGRDDAVQYIKRKLLDIVVIQTMAKKVAYTLRLRVSFLHRDHANLLCILSCLCNVRIRRPERWLWLFLNI